MLSRIAYFTYTMRWIAMVVNVEMNVIIKYNNRFSLFNSLSHTQIIPFQMNMNRETEKKAHNGIQYTKEKLID